VVFAVLVAWALLGELPTSGQLVGGLAIVVGVALVRADEGRTVTVADPGTESSAGRLEASRI
jgi:drug/metabolite transporter (DMT)-like permease